MSQLDRAWDKSCQQDNSNPKDTVFLLSCRILDSTFRSDMEDMQTNLPHYCRCPVYMVTK